jgi:hypothetical protein
MSIKKILVAAVVAAFAITAIPMRPALADGAASTRNIILGGALAAGAAYLIIQHNRKVHEKYAADAAQTAAANGRANDAWAAYKSERHAYSEQVAVNADLKKEIAYQHSIVKQQQRQLAAINGKGNTFVQTNSVAKAPAPRKAAPSQQVAMVSYGWGTI